MLLIKVENSHGELVGAFTAAEAQFSTGSVGYKATAKIRIGDKRYQTQINLVEIGSKPTNGIEAETDEEEPAL